MDYNILVVEDQKEISSIVTKYLDKEGYTHRVAENGFEALEIFNEEEFHLVLLDIMMPGIDGFQVLKEIRLISDVPVIILTAKQQEVDRLKGFDIGADDYVMKPFSPRELVRRIKVVFRRLYKDGDYQYLESKGLKLYKKSMRLLKNDIEISITSAEYQLLHTLMENEGQVLTREQLINKSFGLSYEAYDRNVDSYIKRLRNKIENNPKKPVRIVTKYGSGYIFTGDSE